MIFASKPARSAISFGVSRISLRSNITRRRRISLKNAALRLRFSWKGSEKKMPAVCGRSGLVYAVCNVHDFKIYARYILASSCSCDRVIAALEGARSRSALNVLRLHCSELQKKVKKFEYFGSKGANAKMTQYKPMLCPVCGDFYFSELQEGDDVRKLRCSRCGWRYDLVQTENPDKENGANELSLNAYKAQYARKLADNPQYDFAEENTPAPTPHLCPVCGRHQFRDEWSFDICPFCSHYGAWSTHFGR